MFILNELVVRVVYGFKIFVILIDILDKEANSEERVIVTLWLLTFAKHTPDPDVQVELLLILISVGKSISMKEFVISLLMVLNEME